ncbi:DUF3667 domain-containing protein [Fluviicola sp.]|uniref:DUF3667 domain-containing protein n=1 Tax=Fluviicola sp. TaxID=1917219 RepID=UPI0031E0E399
MTTCTNCNQAFNNNYCGSCGQAAKLKRIDGKYVLHEIIHVLHLEKGILYTIRELLLRPGKSVREYISENRTRLVKPVIFVIVASLIYTVISHWFHGSENEVSHQKQPEAVTAIFEWISHHFGYANMMMGVFIALWLKVFFRKQPFNFFEVLILLCFVMGMGMLLLALLSLIGNLSGYHLSPVADTISIIYCSWAIGQFFNPSKVGSYLKAFCAYSLGMLTFYTLVTLIAILAAVLQQLIR